MILKTFLNTDQINKLELTPVPGGLHLTVNTCTLKLSLQDWDTITIEANDDRLVVAYGLNVSLLSLTNNQILWQKRINSSITGIISAKPNHILVNSELTIFKLGEEGELLNKYELEDVIREVVLIPNNHAVVFFLDNTSRTIDLV